MSAAATVSVHDKTPTARDYFLFAVVVLSWSASWYAIKLQLGEVAVSTSLFWRFAIAAICMWIWVAVLRNRTRFSAKYHLAFAGLGLFIFCLNFTLFYYGGNYLISGLLSVVFSLASIVNLFMAAVLGRRSPRPEIVAGALLGFCGIALMFWPQIQDQSWTGPAITGLALCIAGTISFCIGSQISAALQAKSVSVIAASAWGMSYGACFSFLIAVFEGQSLTVDWTAAYIGSLLFLAIVSSVIAFWSYLNLVGSIGAGRAGYATVIFPVIALIISSFLEGYSFTSFALGGLALVVIGNGLVLGPVRRG